MTASTVIPVAASFELVDGQFVRIGAVERPRVVRHKLCLTCGAPFTIRGRGQRAYCSLPCRPRAERTYDGRQRARYERLKAAGLCARCGKYPVRASLTRCGPCHERVIEAQQRRAL